MNIGNYQIVETLHVGQHSFIYRCNTLDNKSSVIVKVHKRAIPSPEDTLRIKREYNNLTLLNGNGSVKALALERYQHSWLVVMEDNKAISLKKLLPLPTSDISKLVSLAIAMTQALEQIHDCDIIHLNIQPQNILVLNNGRQTKYIDFSMALQNNEDTSQDSQRDNINYLAPEQLQKNDQITHKFDQRTDIYALGIVLYELFSGTLPFLANSEAELRLKRLKRIPRPLLSLAPNLPRQLSEIVMKCLNRQSASRYQSATGLRKDLEECLGQLETNNTVISFPLGMRDNYKHFQISDKLYGLETASEILLNHIKSIRQGSCETVMISGPSGIGKSALVHNVLDNFDESTFFCLSGRFEQSQKHLHYSALIHVLTDLINQVLVQSTDKIQVYKKDLLSILGDCGNLLTPLIPNLALLLGEMPQVQPLPPKESENRFHTIFHNFISYFAKSSHPLIIFLDDMQWADTSTLELLEDLLAEKKINHFLLIGAYREQEIENFLPFQDFLKKNSQRLSLHTYAINPLDQTNIEQLLEDTLHLPAISLQNLATVILQKTKGNPYFLRLFLTQLYEKNFLLFDQAENKWKYSINDITNLHVSDNVLSFLLQRLYTLPKQVQNTLALATCIGNIFDLKSLSLLQEEEDQGKWLWLAVQAEILIPLNKFCQLANESKSSEHELTHQDETNLRDEINQAQYKFVHDGIVHALDLLLTLEQRQFAHLTLARSMNLQTSATGKQNLSLTILQHYNKCLPLLTDTNEMLQVAQLNLTACKNARLTSAYAVALEYISFAEKLLPEDHWETDYKLSFDIYYENALAHHHFEQLLLVEIYIQELMQNAASDFEKAQIYLLQATIKLTNNQHSESISAGFSGLELLGLKIPKTKATCYYSILTLLTWIKIYLLKTSPEELAIKPLINNPELDLKINLLTSIGASAYFVDQEELVGVITLITLKLTLQNGNNRSAGLAYISYAIFLQMGLKDFKNAFRFAQLALSIEDNIKDSTYKCRVNFIYAMIILPWNEHLREFAQRNQKAIYWGEINGDVEYLSYAHSMNNYGFYSNTLLENIIKRGEEETLVQLKNNHGLWGSIALHYTSLKELAGMPLYSSPTGDVNEKNILENWKQSNQLTYMDNYHCDFACLHGAFERWPEGFEHVRQREKINRINTTFFNIPYLLYAFLICSAIIPNIKNGKDKSLARQQMRSKYKQIKKLSAYNPENFIHMKYLMEAEIARHKNNFKKADNLYNLSILAAKSNDYIEFECIANEWRGKFYLQYNLLDKATTCMEQAFNLYAEMGANGKTRHLTSTYPQLLSKTVLNF